MASRTHAETIRTRVRSIFETCGAAGDDEMCESLLIRDGFFCGRRFEMDGLCAVWFVEEDELKVYDRDGALLAANKPETIERQIAA